MRQHGYGRYCPAGDYAYLERSTGGGSYEKVWSFSVTPGLFYDDEPYGSTVTYKVCATNCEGTICSDPLPPVTVKASNECGGGVAEGKTFDQNGCWIDDWGDMHCLTLEKGEGGGLPGEPNNPD